MVSKRAHYMRAVRAVKENPAAWDFAALRPPCGGCGANGRDSERPWDLD